MEIRHFRDLVAWQRAFEFCVQIHSLTQQFPPCELYGLTSQLRRAAVSIPSNIAEGCARMTTGEFIQHLGYARGSLAECETEMLCAIRFGYVEENEMAANLELIQEVGRLINGLIRSLSSLR